MLSRLAADVGKGLFAGAAGTAAMTVSSTFEAKLRGRADSSAPAAAAAAVLGVEPVDDDARQRFNNLAHWGYGIGWGGVRGAICTTGLSAVPATLAHLGAVWGSEQVVLPATGAAPPATEWGPRRSPSTCSTTRCTWWRPGWPTPGSTATDRGRTA
jgi:hypothetical protein